MNKSLSKGNPLKQCIMWGNDAQFIAFLAKYWDINAKDSDGYTPFYHACFIGKIPAARILINMDIKESIETNGLGCICRLCDPETTRIAFEKYGSIFKEQFYSKVDNGYPIKYLISGDDEDKVIETLSILIQNGYDLDATGHDDCPTACEAALYIPFPRLEIMEFLLANNVNIDTPFHKSNSTPRKYLKYSYNPNITELRKKYNIQ
ncbi:hypothetical protein TVAG_115360 [Trichomonas vaginalis G3]|uniref:Uncharacterized protein n=1 Tax=Trichomonas vaginalis (strain ATCC PRA-98 / G3) TaxID=412133 RepID=A2F7H4_TRIV3|nr:Ankyrin repeat family [Trichomonas vaginalis G3]EAX99132.1 hypothetical protein TVAG_115360 [Trichomonas vaginalis G3]KAI5549196.1 Ankyrin repeat family [Trichomonas vaginalis G3]|eukprot:XP_001312062.1 hypothetical protein [Trichomonas vaginalis G3]